MGEPYLTGPPFLFPATTARVNPEPVRRADGAPLAVARLQA